MKLVSHKHTQAIQTAENKARLIDAIRDHGILSRALEATRTPRQNYYRWLEKDKVFADNAQRAFMESTEQVEASLRDIALEGYSEEVIYKGRRAYETDPESGLHLRDEKGNLIPLKRKVRNMRAIELYLGATHPRYAGGEKPPSVHIFASKGGDDEITSIEISYKLPNGKTVEDYESGDSVSNGDRNAMKEDPIEGKPFEDTEYETVTEETGEDDWLDL